MLMQELRYDEEEKTERARESEREEKLVNVVLHRQLNSFFLCAHVRTCAYIYATYMEKFFFSFSSVFFSRTRWLLFH